VKVLVTGGRTYFDRAHVFQTLNRIHREEGPITLLIHGAAAGADEQGKVWAQTFQIPQSPYPAAWRDLTAPGAVIKENRHGKYNARAGTDRNQRMLDEGKPDLVVAFPGGTGTADMVWRAKKAGVRVIEVPVRAGTSNWNRNG
jgi:hypothetical protein